MRQATVVQIVLVNRFALPAATRDTTLNRPSPVSTMALHGETHNPRSDRQEEKNRVLMTPSPMAKNPPWPVFRSPPLNLPPQMQLGALHTIPVTIGHHLPR
jgi:hypothetical protein